MLGPFTSQFSDIVVHCDGGINKFEMELIGKIKSNKVYFIAILIKRGLRSSLFQLHRLTIDPRDTRVNESKCGNLFTWQQKRSL